MSHTILEQLVAFPSITSDTAATTAAAKYVANYLERRGMHITWMKGKSPSFVATTRPDNKAPVVALAGHVDVVPASKELFKLRSEGDKLYGRGVYDMKFAIASYMQVVDILQDSLSEYDFSVMIVADEEIAGKDGASSMKRQIDAGYVPSVAIIPDGGRDWQLETFAKGFMHYSLEAHGQTAHGSRPWEGENALFRLIDALSDLKKEFESHGRDTDTLNIGIIKSGEAVNKIPDYAKAEIEMRLNSLESLTKRSQMIQDLCARHDIVATLHVAWEPIVNDLHNPYVSQFAACVENVLGVKNEGFRSFGGSDARFFAWAGVPYVNFYPFGGGHHSADEWIKADTVDTFTEILLQYLRRMAHTVSVDEQVALAANTEKHSQIDNTGPL